MPRFLKRSLLILAALFLLIVLLVSVTAIKLLMDKDEAALDYSELDVEIPTTDPEVNGYSLMREFTENYAGEIDYDLIEELSIQAKDQWDNTEIEEVLNVHQKLIDGLEQTFGRPIFKFDQDADTETLIPEYQVLKIYSQLKILKARLFQISGDDTSALQEYLKLKEQILTYAECEGPFLCLLISVSQIGILEKELFQFIHEAKISKQEWIQTAQSYNIHTFYANATRSAYKQEFQFASYCHNLAIQDPAQLIQDVRSLTENPEKPSWIARLLHKGTFALCFRPNKTKNGIYRSYLEIANQTALPVEARNLEYTNQLNSQFQKRSRLDMIDSNIIGKILVGIIQPAHEALLRRVAQFQSSSAAIQLSFALRAYHQASGSLPETLDALVPEYIAAIPKDPFDGEPLRYSKAKAILYSVGNDFTDSGGSLLQFAHELSVDDYDDSAELDKTEPTYSLRFAK